MWNVINNDSCQYVLRITELEDCYDIFLSDLKRVWKIQLNGSEILKIIQDLNPHIEAAPKALLDKTMSLLSKSNEDIKFVCELDVITLKVESKIGGFPFKFCVKMNLMPQDSVFQDITLPLVLMVQELKTREEKLFEIIKQKDKEIQDYRIGGAKLSLKQLRTRSFDENVFLEENTDLELPQELIASPVKIFTSPLTQLFESVSKRILENDEMPSKDDVTGDKGNDSPPEISQYSPDLFEEPYEPEAKHKEGQRKMPTLLKVDLKHKKPKYKKSTVSQGKIIL